MRVVALGLLTLDVTSVVTRVPDSNQKLMSLGTTIDFGGPAANAAVTARALGSEVRLVSAAGSGPAAAVVRDLLAGSGVEFVELQGDLDDTPVSTVLVTQETGDRAVVSSHGLVGGGFALPEGSVCDADVLLLDGHYLDAAIAAARHARAQGIPVVLDGGSWKPGLERLVPLVDVAVLSADFAAPQGTVMPRFTARTNGGGPIEFQDKKIDVPRVEVVDTLGAGDVIHGAFAHYVARKNLSSTTVEGCLASAAEVASYSCRFAGAKGWHSAPWATDMMRRAEP